MNIDYNKIITNNFNLNITEEELNTLKEIAIKEKNIIKAKYHTDTIKEILAQKANETAYVNHRYNHLNMAEKAIIASNMVFDDEKFVNILNKGNFSYETLEVFIKLLNYVKYKIKSNNLNEKDNKYLNTVNIFAKKLLNHFIKYTGINDINIIINKLNEVISFNPELLDKMKKTNSR